MRIFLDTNVLVSAFATRGICVDIVRHVLARHELMTGEVNLKELRRVLRKRFRVPERTAQSVEALLREQMIVGRPRNVGFGDLRDPDDRFVLASAAQGRADILVTGDRDLLEYKNSPVPILNPRGFWTIVKRDQYNA